MSRATPKAPDPLLGAALSVSLGAALLLDAELKIALATREAKALLGVEVRPGSLAAKILCTRSQERPVAEALAKGKPVQAIIAHPAQGAAGRLLKVRALPLLAEESRVGWLVLLDDAGASSEGPVLFHGLWTQSPKMKEVFRIIERVASDDASVLVRGETGTGKELAARALHARSRRARGPFQAINCAALPASLLESELFGHVRGAFTGAVSDTPGHFQLADGGTLFLDEVGEMPPELQAKLLRVLETRTVLPVGGRKPITVDVRIISATHRALRREVEEGRFRADLMYRLRVIPIFLPALRERREDIGLLCAKFIEAMNPTARRRIERIAPSVLSLLERQDWPGNVRELRNVLSYAYAVGDGPILQPNDLPPELLDGSLGAPAAGNTPAGRPLSREARRLLDALERTGGNKKQAANILGMSRVTLWRRLQALGLAQEAGAPEGGEELSGSR
ncbi:MAG TPA: sigma 54-interacting transcriptional regulator [Polyangiaceae bacterium]|nr:sigma 54-interacting transcriptional regulator [Polyangiaceae bacterium]